MLIRVLFAFDDDALAARLHRVLDLTHVHVLSVGDDGLRDRLATQSYDLAVFDDALMTGGSDPRVEQIRSLPDHPDVVALCPTDDPEKRAQLIAAGCRAVISTSVDDALLGSALDAVVEAKRAERMEILRARRVRPQAPRPPVASRSPAMNRTLELTRKLALADSAVLILGETGVGKEMLATLLHTQGPRSEGPFVPLNCAAVPSELFESELFGHEKGAFTGAAKARRGQFELADHGTLFLDEVGEVPLALQAKLLRVLQDNQVRPVGGERAVDIDVRVVAATNRDLAREVEAGRFRRDLYYRLGVVELTIPPLRDRPEDIVPLLDHYLHHFATNVARSGILLEDDARGALVRYPWPGNVRELVNVLERAVLLDDDGRIGVDDLPGAVAGYVEPGANASELDEGAVDLRDDLVSRPWREVRETLLREGERAYLVGVLAATRGRMGMAARRAGMSERALFEKMRRHGLRKEDYRDEG